MFVHLNVRYMYLDGKTSSGTLEIAKKTFPGGQITQTFEWRGEGSSDGGTWEWGKDSHGFVAMMLTSNITKTLVGRLKANAWNKDPLPPFEPWFRTGSAGYFTYFSPTGKEFICDWWMK